MDADDAHDQLQRIEEARDKLNDAASGDPTNLHAILRLQEIAALTVIALELRELRQGMIAPNVLTDAIGGGVQFGMEQAARRAR